MMTHERIFSALSTMLLGIILSAPVAAQAAPWSGIIDPTRAIDWSQAGSAHISDTRIQCVTSQCNTVSAGTVTAASINAALNSAPANSYVLIPAGTYQIAGGLTFNNRSNITLRGAGSNSTFLVFTSGSNSGYCDGHDVCALPAELIYPFGYPNSANWTGTNGVNGTYTRGATSILLDSAANLAMGSQIILDQVDDPADNNGLWVGCEIQNSRCGNDGPSGWQRRTSQSSGIRGQQQIVNVTSISGSGPYHVGITPGIYADNWRTSQSPGAWWATTPVHGDAVENISLDHTGGGDGITFGYCTDCWVKGVRSIITSTKSGNGWGHVMLYGCNHCTVRDSYFGDLTNNTDDYVIAVDMASDLLVENNILQSHGAFQFYNSDCEGCVASYNFSAGTKYGDGTDDWLGAAAEFHSVNLFSLGEGNIGSEFWADGYHGTHVLNTQFRNRYDGREPNASNPVSSNTAAIQLAPGSRYHNFIGNILGTPGYHTSYLSTPSNSSYWKAVIVAGEFPGTGGTDSLSYPTSMWWGNWDSVTNDVRWNASEVPSGLSVYANTIPAGRVLPASFIYSSRPSWWPSGKAWPPIGPDVTGGNVGQCAGGTYDSSEAMSSSQCVGGSFSVVAGGKVNSIPAMDCYFKITGGVPNGTDGPLAFNADACYPSSHGDIVPPSVPKTLRIQ